eukprot:scaffold1956_cov173-Skeletonema_marinoi.AAC.1
MNATALSHINEAARVTTDRVIDRSKRDASSWRICRVRHKRTWYLCKSPGSRGTLLSYDKRETRGNTFHSQIDQRSEEKYRNGNSTTKHPDPYDVEE